MFSRRGIKSNVYVGKSGGIGWTVAGILFVVAVIITLFK